MTTIGSLFSGYGGLDMAVEEVTGGRTVWVSDNDPGAAKILAHNWPDVPNLGDITAIDWAAVQPVDVITGGFPCQDLSLAGKRVGMGGHRSSLWSHMAAAVDILRPALVVAENVRGLLSAEAVSEVEPCPWCLGDGPTSDVRALGAVLADLADLGYDAAWRGLAAASVGACHERFRVFLVAWPAADAGRGGRDRRRAGPGAPPSGGAPFAIDRLGERFAADTPGERRLQGRPEPAGQLRRPDAAVCGDATTADAVRTGLEGDGTVGDGEPAQAVHVGDSGTAPVVDWGEYGPAIRRWEHLTGRAAPAPTGMTRKGGQSLAPAFVEFLMGLPAGHVTAVPGLTRNEQLKALGNGVVPQQAAEALRRLLPLVGAA